MLPVTKHSLKKLETLLKELGYTVRYEKGHFTSGYCLVEQRKVAIVNKFYDTEARMGVLQDIVERTPPPAGAEALTPASFRVLKRLQIDYRAATEEEE